MENKAIAKSVEVLLRYEREGLVHEDSTVVELTADARFLPASAKEAFKEAVSCGCPAPLFLEGFELVGPRKPELVRTLARSSYVPRDEAAAHPRRGRFYPQGLFGLATSSLADIVRVCAVDEHEVVVDGNHPLAGMPLELLFVPHAGAVAKGKGYGVDEAYAGGPGMQARLRESPTDFAEPDAFVRADEGADPRFYETPRPVDHIDAACAALLAEFYAKRLPAGANVLDLMSGHNSHLSLAQNLGRVTGLGLGEADLAGNARLDERVQADLNADARLPFATGEFDAVLCSLSIEYLTNPAAVFAEAARVLAPGGLLIASFSHRFFPPKAIKLWQALHPFERVGYVAELFCATPGLGGLQSFSFRGRPRPTEDRYYPKLREADPLFAVCARRRK